LTQKVSLDESISQSEGKMELSKLSVDARYISATAEISARIQSRVQVNVYHIIAILTLVGFVVGASTTDIQNLTHPDKRDLAPVLEPSTIPNMMLFISAAIPLISSVFLLWYLHNDRIIGQLSSYCEGLEKRYSTEEKPFGWFTQDEGWMPISLKYREFSDIAMILVCIISPTVTFLLSFRFAKTSESLLTIVISVLFSFLVTSFNCYALLQAWQARAHGKEWEKRKRDGDDWILSSVSRVRTLLGATGAIVYLLRAMWSCEWNWPINEKKKMEESPPAQE
jgi:hypothetical protein